MSPRRPIRRSLLLEDPERRIYGVQHHPEVNHTEYGQDLLRRFLIELAGCEPTWTMASVIEESVVADPRPDR